MAVKVGRPPFKPTAAMRRRVSIAAGGGMQHQDIAIALGISGPTLRKYFTEELSVGATQRRLEVLEAMHRSARGGNVSAQRAYMALTPAVSAPPLGAGDEAPAAPRRKPGKKEQAQADAQTAVHGTEWGDLLPGAPMQ